MLKRNDSSEADYTQLTLTQEFQVYDSAEAAIRAARQEGAANRLQFERFIGQVLTGFECGPKGLVLRFGEDLKLPFAATGKGLAIAEEGPFSLPDRIEIDWGNGSDIPWEPRKVLQGRVGLKLKDVLWTAAEAYLYWEHAKTCLALISAHDVDHGSARLFWMDMK